MTDIKEKKPDTGQQDGVDPQSSDSAPSSEASGDTVARQADRIEDIKDGVSALAQIGRAARGTKDAAQTTVQAVRTGFEAAHDGAKWTNRTARSIFSGELLENSPAVIRWPVKLTTVWPAKAFAGALKWATLDKNEEGKRELDVNKLGLRSRYFGFPEFTKDIKWGKAAWRLPVVAALALSMVNGAKYGVDVAADGIPMAMNSDEIVYVMHGGAEQNADGVYEAKGFIGENTNENTYHFEIRDNAYKDFVTRLEGISEFDLDKIFDGYDPKFVADQVPTEEQACAIKHHGFYSRFLDRDLQVTSVDCSSDIGQTASQSFTP